MEAPPPIPPPIVFLAPPEAAYPYPEDPLLAAGFPEYVLPVMFPAPGCLLDGGATLLPPIM